MFDKDIDSVSCRDVDYILSPCGMATHGLLAMLHDNNDVAVLDVESEESIDNVQVLQNERMVVYVPNEPYWMLSTLKSLISILNRSGHIFWVLIISKLPASWLWNVIKSQVAKTKIDNAVIHIAPSDLPCDKLSELLLPERNVCPYLKSVVIAENFYLGKHDDLHGNDRKEGLSKKEMQVMAGLFQGVNIAEQADYLGVSKKTLYNQRLSGIKKVSGVIPYLFSSIHEKTGMANGDITMLSRLSSFEREFAHALYSNELFVVFQPVTQGPKNLEGFEILIRWYSKGHVLTPNEFLPKLHSTYVWIILTAFLIQKTVSYINFYQGKYFFSINIESSTIDNDGLVRMLETAKKQLSSSDWTKKFVLEINERNDLSQNEQSLDNLAYLQKLDFSIVLDDCFSRNSVNFPVRKFQFDGYKLDMNVVDALSRDREALALVKSLSYYCKLTNRYCIAEGVDRPEKMDILQESGISFYQGNYISEPITGDELPQFISEFTVKT
ncbi:TPA: EAL domain-containing protein [Kluyvera ascorbata]|jgi:FOG: EAL domain|nr:EAL domain-containing protein [Kluyvera ascorbata]HDG1682782.1 EAL domain-containing protein [Kluyvera ascorbata]